METECYRASAIVKVDFRVLVRCEMEIRVPKEEPKILSFYQKTAEAAVRWCKDFLGVRAKKEYAALPDLFAQARFLPYRFRLRGGVVYEDAEAVAVVCESVFSRGNEQTVRRSAQVWNKWEKTIFPTRLVLRRFREEKLPKQKDFRLDGCYPESGKLILFQNADSKTPFVERKLQISEKQK